MNCTVIDLRDFEGDIIEEASDRLQEAVERRLEQYDAVLITGAQARDLDEEFKNWLDPQFVSDSEGAKAATLWGLPLWVARL